MLDLGVIGRRGPGGRGAHLHHTGLTGWQRRLGVGHGRVLVVPYRVMTSAVLCDIVHFSDAIVLFCPIRLGQKSNGAPHTPGIDSRDELIVSTCVL
jgi:hypothetical protein